MDDTESQPAAQNKVLIEAVIHSISAEAERHRTKAQALRFIAGFLSCFGTISSAPSSSR